MRKCYTEQELVGGLNNLLNNQYQEERARTFDPKWDTKNIKEYYQEVLNDYVSDVRDAQANYVPEMKEDIVFGNDKWTSRERFNYQKKQLYSALCASRASENLKNTIDQLESEIAEVATPFTVDEESVKRAYAKYEQETINNIVNKQVGVNQRKVEGFKRKRAKFVGLMIPGIILAVIFAGVAAYFWWQFSVAYNDYKPLLDYGDAETIIEMFSKVKALGQNFGFAISSTILTIAGIGMIIPQAIYGSKRKKYFKTLKAMTPIIKEDLKVSSERLIEDYRNRYAALASESATYRRAAADTMVGCVNVFRKHRDNDPSFAENYVFCRNLPYKQIYCLYDYMETGIVDSYTAALQYYNSEVQKAMERLATEQYREKTLNMNKEHYSKMESAAQEQTRAIQEQARSAAAQAAAAADAAYYARIQAEESRKQTKEARRQTGEARRQTNIIRRW